MSASVSGSPNLTLYSRTFGPLFVSINPVNNSPTKGKPLGSEQKLLLNGTVVPTFSSHTVNGGLQGFLEDPLHHCGSGYRCRGICTHTPGVKACVPFTYAFVVLRGR